MALVRTGPCVIQLIQQRAGTMLTCRGLTVSTVCQGGGEWRHRHGKGRCGNEYGPLVDIPDWSYADGRPAPIGTSERLRREQQKTMAKRMMKYIHEMQFAKEYHQQKKHDAQEARHKKIQSRLKPKNSPS